MAARYRVAPKEERTADNIVFASRHEMETYLHFKALLRAGTFKEVLRQVPFPISINGVHVFKYIADFVVTAADGTKAVYDAKGHRTELYKLKKRCVEALYNIRIIEI